MKLSELVRHAEGTTRRTSAEKLVFSPGADPEIKGISSDSRKIKPGWLFVALGGNKADGARFMPQALEAGARF